MADREREKKKKRAYLDDFEKDLNGNYQYRGAHYRYAGEPPHQPPAGGSFPPSEEALGNPPHL